MPVLRSKAPKRVMRPLSFFLFRSWWSGRSGSSSSGSPTRCRRLLGVRRHGPWNLVTVSRSAIA